MDIGTDLLLTVFPQTTFSRWAIIALVVTWRYRMLITQYDKLNCCLLHLVPMEPEHFCSTRVQGPVLKSSGGAIGRDGRTLQPHTDVSASRLHGGLDTTLQVSKSVSKMLSTGWLSRYAVVRWVSVSVELAYSVYTTVQYLVQT